MKRRPIWKLEVDAEVDTEGPVAEFLSQRLGQPCSSYTDLKTGRITVTVYFPHKPDWSKAARSQLLAALTQIAGPSPAARRFPLRLTRLRTEDWAESWKRHFRPLEIGRRLLIQPTWGQRRSKPGQVCVRLDPGMSFGTGQHPTTAFCLRELARASKSGPTRSFLDLGTGSGILAICAARLGYDPVEAIEMDREALAIARANAQLNGVARRIRFKRQDLGALSKRSPRQYSLVCANLIASLLLDARRPVAAAVRPGGRLVLAGILQVEFSRVSTAYEAMGLRLARSRGEGEWRSGTFVR